MIKMITQRSKERSSSIKGERNASALDPPEGHLVLFAREHGTQDISEAR